MQALAIAGQWEALPPLQAQRMALMATQSTVTPPIATASDDIRHLIADIQACDRVVSEHVRPLREQLAAWLPAPATQP